MNTQHLRSHYMSPLSAGISQMNSLWIFMYYTDFWVISLIITFKVMLEWFSSVQSLSHVLLFATPWITARQASLSITNTWKLLKLMPIELVMPSSHLILCHPLLLPPPIPPSIRVFSNESTLCMRWPKYWSFSFSISTSNEHPGLISFRMDWLDLLSVQGTLKSLFQHHSSKVGMIRDILHLKYPMQGLGICLNKCSLPLHF